jgi:membrane-associated phospholipid phosphatase
MLKTRESTIPSTVPDQQAHPHQLRDFRSPLLLGRYPLIGLLMVLIGGGLFAVMAFNLQTQGPLIPVDQQIALNLNALALHSSPFMVSLMEFGFYFAEYGFIIIGAALLLYFLVKRYWTEFWMVGIAWGGEGPLWYFLSDYFNRPRPTFTQPLWRYMSSPGFPSGHSLAAVMCLGLIAYLLIPKLQSAFWKAVVVILTLAIIIYVGYSRMFVGDHYLTDILSGYGVGLAWSGLVYTVVERIALRRKQHKANRSGQAA